MESIKYNEINILAAKILSEAVRRYQTLIIGIDGCGGSGKTTFARKLNESLPNSTIVQMDDFYDGEHIIWQRVLQEVLIQIANDQEARYQAYDWETGKLGN